MTTAERASALAEVARRFPILGEYGAEDLLELVRLELGHAEILDGFRPYAGHFSKAMPRSPILHIVSGNTPHAALQSLQRGLLVGAENLVKIPSQGLATAEEYVDALPPELRSLVTVSRELPGVWLKRAKVCVVFGEDETIAHFRRQISGDTIYEPHGTLFSLGVVFEDAENSARMAAVDVSRFNQKGCLSPHDIYVAGDARAYAARLAEAMEAYRMTNPPEPITSMEAAEIHDLRANYRFRSSADPRVQIWESEGSLAWTVIFEEDAWFAASCLNRVVFVKPLPEDLAPALGPALGWIGAVGIWPAEPGNAEKVLALEPSRICPLGRMQDPTLTWHQEGRKNLSPLVRWVDFEPNSD